MSELKIKIESIHAELLKSLNSLIDDNGKIYISSFGNITRFKSVEDAELYAQYSFPNEDYYSINDDTYALSE
jgi:hypothetical protein